MHNHGMTGKILINAGVVDAVALDRALEVRLKNGASIGKALADLGLAEEEAVTTALGKGLHLESLGKNLPEISAEVYALLPLKFCRQHLVVPLSVSDKSLRLAMADPLDYPTIQNVMFRTSKQVVAFAASQTSILTL